MIIFLSLLFSIPSFAESTYSSSQLSQLWQNESIYFSPKNKDDLILWNGIIYDYSTKKCTDVKQADDGTIKSKELKCDSSFLKKAEEPYLKIAEFSLYKMKLLGALDKEDKPLLNKLISKTIMLSFGVDGLQDRREIIFNSWKSADYKRLAKLIRAGTLGDDAHKTFPPKPDNDGTGLRGEFKKADGGWLLVSYLAGD